ncbi:Acg family FMN-binding oxidoreductase [Kribbella shirazensis]|uniref:Nitroreductase n=1 Tax=Kribbella shirazensis TaxID=1105143 RepID=A0A7X6A2C5_9ACTN|nr:nitroreductase family protein [Kribbella shirazensis]NIK59136.1 nitroreductase [Kribbella shirazensis]
MMLSTVPDGDRQEMLRLTVAAPSMHNTQPWRFRFRGWVVEVYRDRERELPAEDPGRRMLFVTMGAAIFNLRVAAAYLGYGSHVHQLRDRRKPDLVAEVELSGPRVEPLAALAPAILRRRTNREPFTDQRVPDDVRRRLEDAARIETAELQWLERPSRRWWLQMATNEAVAADDGSTVRTAERSRWVGGDRKLDGVPSSALGPLPAGGTTVVRDLAATAADEARIVAAFEREPQMAILATRYDGPLEWLRAGQAMERVLLEATAHGVSTSLLNQVIEHEGLRWQINDPLGPWRRPQAVIRFGYGPPVPATPRRPIADVLLPDDPEQEISAGPDLEVRTNDRA